MGEQSQHQHAASECVNLSPKQSLRTDYSNAILLMPNEVSLLMPKVFCTGCDSSLADCHCLFCDHLPKPVPAAAAQGAADLL